MASYAKMKEYTQYTANREQQDYHIHQSRNGQWLFGPGAVPSKPTRKFETIRYKVFKCVCNYTIPHTLKCLQVNGCVPE